MLSFAMVTRNEGRALDDTLQGLGRHMGPADHLIAIDAGSTDRTVSRLMEFAERAPCTVFQLDVERVSPAEALILALDAGKAPFAMWLGPRDHLQPQALVDLRQCLQTASPDLAVINSGWWYATPDRIWPRADAHMAAACPQAASRDSLLSLCPDPRRLVIAQAALPQLRPILSETTSDPALYTALVTKAARNAHAGEAPAVLHPQDTSDPAPQLETLLQILRNETPADGKAMPDIVAIWSDDAVLRTAPDQAGTLCEHLQAVWQAAPAPVQDALMAHDGPSGAVFCALGQTGIRDAMLHFALSALARQQQQSAHLAAAYAHLQQSVQAALPGPDYLRRLYDRARNI